MLRLHLKTTWSFMLLCLLYTKISGQTEGPLPSEFDARDKWPMCLDLINHLHSQAEDSCTAAWAITTASAISDRVCISSSGKTNTMLSAQEMLECCSECGSCLGGQPIKAWQFWVDQGLPTGGGFQSNEGCKPFTVDATDPTPSFLPCNRVCRSGHGGSYNDEKNNNKGMTYSDSLTGNVKGIQEDIFKNGPVVAVVKVFVDFLQFNPATGVYIPSTTISFGSHIIKIIGWGTENGVDYWLCVNLFHPIWTGVFKFRRGADDAGIESTSITMGLPRTVANPGTDPTQMTDVVFVVDSVSAGPKVERTINGAVTFFDIPARYQVGIVLASNTAQLTLQLGKETDKINLLDDMDDYVYQSGSAPIDIAAGIRLAQQEILMRGRPGVFKLIIILIKNTEINTTNAVNAARLAQKAGTSILLAATDTQQQDILQQIPDTNQFRFIVSGELGQGLPEDDVFYVLPLLIEQIEKSIQPCWDCMFESGVYYQDIPGSCTMYYHCKGAGDRNPRQRACPLGKFFNRDTLNCVWPTTAACSSDPCAASNVNWANAHHCGAYWECSNGRTSRLRCCGAGERWSQTSQTCVPDSTCNPSTECEETPFIGKRSVSNSFLHKLQKRQAVCTYDFFLAFDGPKLGDQIKHLWVKRRGVRRVRDSLASDGWAGYFNGDAHASVPFYANKEMHDNIEIYVSFRIDPSNENLIQMLVTDGGCVPLEPSVFVGFQSNSNFAYAYIRTEKVERQISLQLANTDVSGYVKLWYLYDGVELVLESEDDSGNRYRSSSAVSGYIRRTRNSLKIGSSNYPYFGHGAFQGHIDEVAVRRCE